MPNRIGPSRAIVQKAYRRGYKQAADDLIDAIAGHVPSRVFGRLKHWQHIARRWHRRLNVATTEEFENAPAPRPKFERRAQQRGNQ